MDFSSKSKNQLKLLAETLNVEVPSKKRNKPTSDELVSALEIFEDENPGRAEEAFKVLGIIEDDEGDDLPENIYTYVGKGEASPQRINFIGRQEFIRGRPTVVKDPLVLNKIKGVPTFVEGEADPELLQDIEDEGSAVADKNREVDKKMNETFKKQHGGTA